MKIEDEIKQTKPFESEYQKLVINIHFTSSWLNSEFVKILKPYSISPAQFNVLRILKGKYPEGHSNQSITERMIDKSSNATRIVDKLLEKKLIERKQLQDDRRAVNIKITQKGLDLLSEINLGMKKFKKMMASFNVENAKLMNEWLDEIRK